LSAARISHSSFIIANRSLSIHTKTHNNKTRNKDLKIKNTRKNHIANPLICHKTDAAKNHVTISTDVNKRRSLFLFCHGVPSWFLSPKYLLVLFVR